MNSPEINAATKTYPLKMVGSTVFGRYPKISLEQTFNLIISDGFMVPFAGHMAVNSVDLGQQGRGIYASSNANKIFMIIDDILYEVTENLSINIIERIETFTGDVFITEDLAKNVAICDGKKIYIYNWESGAFYTPVLDFIPNYISFQNAQFIASVANPDTNKGFWRLSNYNGGLVEFPATFNFVGEFQTNADIVQATVRIPGRGNNIYIFGRNSTEIWNNLGLAGFPYLKNTTSNLEYGCLNSSTIAYLDTLVVWLGGNNQAGATIMYSTGEGIKQISNDGINFKLASLSAPENSYGFLFRQDGHVFYVITFYTDNVTYAYDFNEEKFYTLTDENLNYYIAKKVVFYNNNYYFISINDGNFYELSSTIQTYNGKTIPRIRICPSIRDISSLPFILNQIAFTMEQGESNEVQKILVSVSYDGGASFGSSREILLNHLGRRQNVLRMFNFGRSNDIILQFRFYAKTRTVFTDGIAVAYK